MNTINFEDEKIISAINNLVAMCGGSSKEFEGDLIGQMILNSLKMLRDGHDIGQLKLMTRSLKEMRYAYRIFNQYKGNARCISLFGSARTPENHPDYIAAKKFSLDMAASGWMCMTGGANGIMKAGLEGLNQNERFGLSIRLPFESTVSSVIEGDERHIVFRYFFTRKLMFMSHSDALAAFPGGFGTLDELFEMLTLMQTGKASIIPLVLVQGTGGNYWNHWEEYMQKELLKNGWIHLNDRYFYHIASSPEEAASHVRHFYKRYHSSRYVKDEFVIRLKEPLSSFQIDELNERFAVLVSSGVIRAVPPFPEEAEHLELPRISFLHTRKDYGFLRALIDVLNSFPIESA